MSDEQQQLETLLQQVTTWIRTMPDEQFDDLSEHQPCVRNHIMRRICTVPPEERSGWHDVANGEDAVALSCGSLSSKLPLRIPTYYGRRVPFDPPPPEPKKPRTQEAKDIRTVEQRWHDLAPSAKMRVWIDGPGYGPPADPFH